MNVKSLWVSIGVAFLMVASFVTYVFSEEPKEEITLEEVRVVATPIIEGNWVSDKCHDIVHRFKCQDIVHRRSLTIE